MLGGGASLAKRQAARKKALAEKLRREHADRLALKRKQSEQQQRRQQAVAAAARPSTHHQLHGDDDRKTSTSNSNSNSNSSHSSSHHYDKRNMSSHSRRHDDPVSRGRHAHRDERQNHEEGRHRRHYHHHREERRREEERDDYRVQPQRKKQKKKEDIRDRLIREMREAEEEKQRLQAPQQQQQQQQQTQPVEREPAPTLAADDDTPPHDGNAMLVAPPTPDSPVFDCSPAPRVIMVTPPSVPRRPGEEPVTILDSDDEEQASGTATGQSGPWESQYRGCRSVHNYKYLNKIDAGAFGTVFRARNIATGEVCALKKITLNMQAGVYAGFPITSLRETNILLALEHPNIIGLREVVVDDDEGVFMAMEYSDNDLKSILQTMKSPFRQAQVKSLLQQLLRGVHHMHDHWVMHRDLKASNLLYSNDGGLLKIADFGLARQFGAPLGKYTELVVTLWYRAPELLLGCHQYGPEIDMWSVGCLFYEMLTRKPLFPGRGEMDQIRRIFDLLGTPSEACWAGFDKLRHVENFSFKTQPHNRLRKAIKVRSFSAGEAYLGDHGFDLLSRLLTYDPAKRITADEALAHPWFTEYPLPLETDKMPNFSSLNVDADKRQEALDDAARGVPRNTDDAQPIGVFSM